MEHDYEAWLKQKEEERKKVREAVDELKLELIKVFKLIEITNWLASKLNKIKWLR